MTDAFEVGDQCGQTRTEQSGLANRGVDGGVVRFLALGAPVGQGLMLNGPGGFGDQFNLLHDAWRFVTEFQATAAIGTARQRVRDGVVDLVGFQGGSLMALMSPLPAWFAFFVRLGTRRLDDITGRRLGRSGRILLGGGKLTLGGSEFTLDGGKVNPQLGNFRSKLLHHRGTSLANRRVHADIL